MGDLFGNIRRNHGAHSFDVAKFKRGEKISCARSTVLLTINLSFDSSQNGGVVCRKRYAPLCNLGYNTMNPLDLRSVYKAIRNTYPGAVDLPMLPDRQADKAQYDVYEAAFSSLIESVPNTAGVYLWFARTNDQKIEFIYVGEAGRSTMGLQRRFSEEFKNWHHCFWATCFGSNKYLAEAITIYVESGRYNPTTTKYTNTICNDWLKRGATHLAYRTDLPIGQLKTIQDDLIQLFANPRGNIADRRKQPLPDNQLLSISKQVHQELLQLTTKAAPYDPRLELHNGA